MSKKIGFIVSEFLPTKNFIIPSLEALSNQKSKVYFLPIYSPSKKSNNNLLIRIIKETSFSYILYKILDTFYVNIMRKILRSSIKDYVKKRGIENESLNLDFNELEKKIKSDKIDVLVLLTNQYIPKKVLDSPYIVTVNLHLAKIPEYGGLFNQFWLMLADEKYSYATIHIASAEIDAGHVLLEDKIEVDYKESMMKLYYDTSVLGGELLKTFIENFDHYYDKNKIYNDLTPTNRGLPNRSQIKIFRKKNLKLSDYKTLKLIVK